jgi:uncharacterized RDD family membrane protein YckC
MAQIFCPFCGAKNEESSAKCFVCEKPFPWVGWSGAAKSTTGQQRARNASPRTMSAAMQAQSAAPAMARLGDRLIAVILDGVFVAALLLIIAAFVEWRWKVLESQSTTTLIIAGASAAVLLTFIYYWLQEGAFGATMGKAIIGLRVTRQDGSVPGLGPSAVRNAFRLVEGLPLYVPGFFVAAFSRNRRRIGDFAAQTFVLEHAVTVPERVTVVLLWLAGISAAVWGAWMLCPMWFKLPLH